MMQTSSLNRVPAHPTRSDSTPAGRAYSDVGDRYPSYADCDPRGIYAFDSRYSYADREVWSVINYAMTARRAEGARAIRVLDAGCGPGTWIRRVVRRAEELGFRQIRARGFDVADGQIKRARALSSHLLDPRAFKHIDVDLKFDVADITQPFPEEDGVADITLCLYTVLNHVTADKQAPVIAELARVTSGDFIATVRAAGSPPTIFVDGIERVRGFRQDHAMGVFDVELEDGRRMRFDARLFTSSQLRRLVSAHFEIQSLRGLDLFHERFAPDPRWNPDWLPGGELLRGELAQLEARYGADPRFMDHAAHLLCVARSNAPNARGS
jgi:SAM-dependent methyltransferase